MCFVCVFICICVYYIYIWFYTYIHIFMCLYMCVYVCLCVQRPEVNISHLPPFLFIFEIGSLTELVAQKFT